MDQSPLVVQQIEAGSVLAAAFDSQYKPLKAAFWLKEDEESLWTLCLASDEIDSSNRGDAFQEVLKLLPEETKLWIDPFQVKVMGTADSMVQEVLEIQRKYPALLPTRIRTRMLGKKFVDEAFIYPPDFRATVVS